MQFEDSFGSVDEVVEFLNGDFWHLGREGMSDEEKVLFERVLTEKLEKEGSLTFGYEV